MAQTHLFQQKPRILLLTCMLLLTLSGCGSLSAPSTSSGGGADIIAPLPVIASGRVYVNTGTLQVFDQKTGKRLDTYKPGNANLMFRLGPVVTDGSIYIAGDEDASKTLMAVYALQAKNGAILWQKSVDSASVLGAANGLLYIYGQEKNSQSFLMAFRMSNGTLDWQYQIASSSGDAACLVLTSGIIYICPLDTSLVALNGETGLPLWQHTVEQGPIYGATLANGLIYLNERGGISAHRLTDGAELWYASLIGNVATNSTLTPVVANDGIYTIASDHSKDTMYALNARSGSILWHRSLANSGAYGQRPLAVAGDIVFYANVYNTPYSPTSTPTVHQGASLTALRANDGSMLWQNWIGGFADPSLSIENQTIYAVSQLSDMTTYLNAWQMQTGKLLWHTPAS
jgi:outer membrane protein assembly factor BamB